ncbi:hypothetical protein OHR68_39700 [Spirillospora sp. NBC_00431]
MDDRKLERIAELLAERNTIDAEIATIVQRPMTAGHLGEWIAARIFDIELEASATNAAFDGRFRAGPLQGRTVNVKWYLKQEGLLDLSASATPDHYLVLAGPRAAAESSRGGTRPWCVRGVFLFDARRLRDEQHARGVRAGTASSVLRRQWDEAEIYPHGRNPLLPVSPDQVEMLELLAG